VQTQPPSSVLAGTGFGVVVDVDNQNGTIDSSFDGNVSVALPAGSSASLGGVTTVAAKNGVATFTGLTLSPSSSPVTLLVTSAGVTRTATNSISVTTPATSADLAFSASSVTVKENVGKATITVMRTGAYQGPVTVDLATSGGTAVAGKNYTAVNEVLSFAAGQDSQTVAIPIKNAGTLAAPLSVGVVLSNPGTNAALGVPSTETVVIQNAPLPPLVTVASVQLETNKKHQVVGIVVDLSGAVNAAEAQSIATYELVAAGKGNSFTAKNAKMIRIKSAAYNASTHQVILTPSPFGLSKPVEFVVYGNGPHGLQDAEGRYIDGAHKGVSGTNAVAVFSKGGVTMHAVPRGPLAVKGRR
jgi:hypothetical protein